MPRRSVRLTKGYVSKYKNTLKEAIPLDSEGEEAASIDIQFTNPEVDQDTNHGEEDTNEEDVVGEEKTQTTEIDKDLKSIDFNRTQTTIGEDEELDADDEVPDSNEFNEKVPSSESDEHFEEVNETMFKEDLLKMRRGKDLLTKKLVAKFRSTP